jgi:hypothetical protein
VGCDGPRQGAIFRPIVGPNFWADRGRGLSVKIDPRWSTSGAVSGRRSSAKCQGTEAGRPGCNVAVGLGLAEPIGANLGANLAGGKRLHFCRPARTIFAHVQQGTGQVFHRRFWSESAANSAQKSARPAQHQRAKSSTVWQGAEPRPQPATLRTGICVFPGENSHRYRT